MTCHFGVCPKTLEDFMLLDWAEPTILEQRCQPMWQQQWQQESMTKLDLLTMSCLISAGSNVCNFTTVVVFVLETAAEESGLEKDRGGREI